MWLYVQQGVFEPELFEHSYKNASILGGPGLDEWWRSAKYQPEWPQGFVERMDEIFGPSLTIPDETDSP